MALAEAIDGLARDVTARRAFGAAPAGRVVERFALTPFQEEHVSCTSGCTPDSCSCRTSRRAGPSSSARSSPWSSSPRTPRRGTLAALDAPAEPLHALGLAGAGEPLDGIDDVEAALDGELVGCRLDSSAGAAYRRAFGPRARGPR